MKPGTFLFFAFLIFTSLNIAPVLAQNPNFSEHVAPIIYQNCTGCHRAGGIAPFSLTSFGDVFSERFDIQSEVNLGHMPPWPPDAGYQNFANERTLTQAEKNTINDWVNNGAPRGDSTLAPCPPDYAASSFLGVPDLKLTIPTYTSNASANADDYVCFAIPSGLATDKIIQAMEIIPGNRAIVHHVIVYADPTGTYQTNTSGSCMGPGNAPVVGAYAPGSLPTIFPPGMGVRLQAGAKVILAMHYPEGSAGQVDSTSVHFFFYPDSVTTTREVSVAPVAYDLSFCVPANNANYTINKNSGTIPTSLSVLSVFPHMHLLGKSISSFAVTPINDTIHLIRISEWDFEWQGFYYYRNVIKIPAGSVIYSTGVYDNSIANPNNPNSPPQTVCGGLNTTDEMFIVSLQVAAYQNGDENINLESLLAPPQPVISANGPSSLCNGPVTLIANPGYPSYRWCPGGQTSQNITVSSPGAYYVEVKDDKGIPGNSNTIMVTTGNATPPSVGNQRICAGANATLTASGGASYSWSNGATGASIMVSPVATVSYTVTATDGNGCTASSNATVIVSPIPSPTILPATISICNGESATLTVAGGTSFAWSNTATTASITVSPVSTISYTVTVTDANSCTASASKTVTVNPLPVASISPSTNSICNGGSSTLTANGGTSYAWSNAAITASITVSPVSNASYTVTVTDANGCTETSSSSIQVNPLPIADAGQDVIICSGLSSALNASGGVGYLWDNGETSSLITVNPFQTTSYSVTVIDANGCSDSDDVTVTVEVCTGSQSINTGYQLDVFPNPVGDVLQIYFASNNATHAEVIVNDVNGRIKFSEKTNIVTGNFHRLLDIRSYAKGVYFLRIVTENESVVRKILVN